MGATTIDVRITDRIQPVAWNDGARGRFEWDEATQAPKTITKLAQAQTWQVARAYLVERIGELFRCEVLLTRIEAFPDDPALNLPGSGFFDRLADRIDDDDP